MQREVRGIPEHLRSMEIPKIFTSKFRHIDSEKIFYTDGSRIEEATGFGIFNNNVSVSFKLQEPASVYIAELAAVHYSLSVIVTLSPNHYFLFTDSLSAIEAIRSNAACKNEPFFLGKIKQCLNVILNNSYQIPIVWVPAHCSIPGNERADILAKRGAIEGEIYERPIAFNEFYSASRQRTLASWQASWDKDDLGRWMHSIIPKISTKAWFRGLDVSRDFIRVMSRLMSNHYTLDAHLLRIGLSETNHCACGEGYPDIDHVVWTCVEYRDVRSQLLNCWRTQGRLSNVPVRDILACRDLPYMKLLYHFIKSIGVPI
ncbi:uncharacterized protein LOC131426943 [Malaya genurostris]|uniref:uncharacterized protein LOC131426943 n=1 Tax=Malaya genurostris TaxID=325434 RepID=UPI0026F408EC|nr:uncharacterized protein LOC131426943 [Malaya genurostris]